MDHHKREKKRKQKTKKQVIYFCHVKNSNKMINQNFAARFPLIEM
jgi:uncharacterized protein (DUF302 family)